MSRHRSRPTLESLEGRWCPALNVFLDAGGNLSIFGTPQSGVLNLTINTADTVTVEDPGFLNMTSLAVPGRMFVSLGNTTTGVVVNYLQQDTFGGSVTIRLGNNLAPSLIQMIGLPGSNIGGDVNLSVGNSTLVGAVFLIDSLPISGNVRIQGGGAGDSVVFNNSVVGGTLIEGNVYVSLGNGVNNSYTSNPDANIGGNLTVTGGSDIDSIVQNANVAGSAVYNLGSGANTFLVPNTSTVGGNLTYVGGSGDENIITFDATVLGNTTFIMRGGSDQIGSASFAPTLHANLTISKPVGNSTFNFDGTLLGNSLTYIGSTGTDSVTFGANTSAIGARLDVRLGNSNDTVDMSAIAVALSTVLGSARIDGGFGVDVFVPPATPIDIPFSLVRIP